MEPSQTLASLAAACDGELLGDPDHRVTSVASLGSATLSDLSFLVDVKKISGTIDDTPGVLLVSPAHQSVYSGNRILVDDPYLAYARLSGLFAKQSDTSRETEIHPDAVVHPDASIGQGCCIGARSVVGARTVLGTRVSIGAGAVVESDCNIGEATVIESGAVVCTRSRVGARCTVSPGAIVGSSGFGYAPSSSGWRKIYQLGAVQIGDDVDIGSNATIDRGAIDDTVIGNRVKLDNHVQIAHNVQIGDDTIMAAFVGVAGSARIGKNCSFGGRSSIMGHITICDNVAVHTNTFVARSISEPGVFSSMLPAQPAAQWRKTVVLLNRLDKLATTVRKLTGRSAS